MIWYTSADKSSLLGVTFPDGTWFMVGRNDPFDQKIVAIDYAPAGLAADLHEYGLVVTVE